MSKKPKPAARKPRKATKAAVPPPEPSVVEAGPDDNWPDDPAVTGGVDDPAGYPLPNPKQEAFAQCLAANEPVHDAYLKAGYTGNPANARRLRCDEAVWKRIKWLQAEIGKRFIEKHAEEEVRHIKVLNYGREEAFDEARRVLDMALAMGQSGAAVSAVKLRAEIAGIKFEESPAGAGDQGREGHVAKSLEDPQVVADILNVRAARKLMLAGGKDVEAREKKPA